jgi:hypothetical protein
MKRSFAPPTLLVLSITVLLASACSNVTEEQPTAPLPNDLETTTVKSQDGTLAPASGGDSVKPVTGEFIYVPIYSSIFHLDVKRTIDLAATLSIHNTDMAKSITLRKVDYHDLKGRLIRPYLETDRLLQPLETVNFVIEHRDRTGGTGANFLVEWDASAHVSSPIVEAVMISSSQGISFITTGKVIRRLDTGAE